MYSLYIDYHLIANHGVQTPKVLYFEWGAGLGVPAKTTINDLMHSEWRFGHQKKHGILMNCSVTVGQKLGHLELYQPACRSLRST